MCSFILCYVIYDTYVIIIYIHIHTHPPAQGWALVARRTSPGLEGCNYQSHPQPPGRGKGLEIESVMPSNQLILCRPLLLPPSGSFPMSQFFTSDGQSTGVPGGTSG